MADKEVWWEVVNMWGGGKNRPWWFPGNNRVVFGGGAAAEYNATCPAITPTVGPSELLTNNTFETDTVWLKGAGWTIDTGAKVGVGSNASSLLRQQPLTVGEWYQVSWDVLTLTGGATMGYVGVGNTQHLVTGSFVATGRAANTNAGLNSAVFYGTVDNIYCKLIAFATMRSLLKDIKRKSGTYICHPTVVLDTQCGLILEYADDNNLVVAYINRGDGKAYLDKRIAGTWSNVCNGAITYSDGAELKIVVDASGNHSLYYNTAQVSTTQNVTQTALGTSVLGFTSLASNTVGGVSTNP